MRGTACRRSAPFAATVLVLALLLSSSAFAEGRTVEGTIVRIDPGARTLSIQDGLGTIWNFTVDRGAGVDLRRFGKGARVSVAIARATPLNMSTVADRIRKGDRLSELPAGRKTPSMSPPRR